MTTADASAMADRVYEAASSDFRSLEDEPPLGDVATFGYKRVTTKGLRDFTKMSRDDIINTAWALYQSNGVAKRALTLKRDYILGRNCAITTADEDLRPIYDTFCDINRLDYWLPKFTLDLFLFGELCLPAFVRQADGQTRLGYLDPSEIEAVLCHPHNVLAPWIVICKLRQDDRAPRVYRIIQVDQDFVRGNRVMTARQPGLMVTDTQANIQPWELAFLNANKLNAYTGSAFYFSVNNVTNQPRGFSDLLQSADMLDLYDETLFALGEREGLAGYFSWDVTLTEQDEGKVKARAAEIRKAPPTKKGAINVHNDSETWEFNYPDLKAPQTIATAEALKSQAANGLGQPAHWHNLDNTATRTTAESQNNPTWKTLEHDQAEIRQAIEHIFCFVRDQAQIAGVYTPSEAIDNMPIIGLPEIAERDTSQASQTLAAAVQALTVAQIDLGVITRDTTAKVIARLIGELGVEIDAMAELEAIGEITLDEDEQTIEAVTRYLNGTH